MLRRAKDERIWGAGNVGGGADTRAAPTQFARPENTIYESCQGKVCFLRSWYLQLCAMLAH